MASGKLTIKFQRRRAEVTVQLYVRDKLKLLKDKYMCHVQGPFQEQDGEYATPVFVCELDDGRVFTTAVENVRFVDTVGEVE